MKTIDDLITALMLASWTCVVIWGDPMFFYALGITTLGCLWWLFRIFFDLPK